MTVRDSAPWLLSGTAFQAVNGGAAGPVPGEMWENQLAEIGHFSPTNQKVVQLSKLGFPKSDPSLEVISLDHGLSSTLRLSSSLSLRAEGRPEGEAPCHETRDYGHLVVQLHSVQGMKMRRK